MIQKIKEQNPGKTFIEVDELFQTNYKVKNVDDLISLYPTFIYAELVLDGRAATARTIKNVLSMAEDMIEAEELDCIPEEIYDAFEDEMDEKCNTKSITTTTIRPIEPNIGLGYVETVVEYANGEKLDTDALLKWVMEKAEEISKKNEEMDEEMERADEKERQEVIDTILNSKPEYDALKTKTDKKDLVTKISYILRENFDESVLKEFTKDYIEFQLNK